MTPAKPAALTRRYTRRMKMAAKRIDRQIDVETGNVTFTVMDSGKALVVNASELSEEIRTRVLMHGLNAKVGDSAADPEVDAFTQLVSTWDQLVGGTWNVRGSGGGSRVTVLAEAMFAIQNGDLTLDDIVDRLEAMSKEQRRDIPKKYAKVKLAMDEIKLKRASEKTKLSKKAAAKDESNIDELLA